MADGTTTAARPRRARKAPAITTPDPVEIAMEAEARRTEPVGVAHRVLERHERLIGWQIASERAGFAMKVLTSLAGLAAAAALSAMAWQASRADGLVVRPFSVPRDLAERGITGETLASQLLDRIEAMQAVTRTGQITRQFSADWGDDPSIEIPQAGMSLAQLDQWLRDKLGRQVRVTGELTRTPEGKLSLTTRIGSRALPTQTGSEAEMERLLQGVAEAMYATESPTVYSTYLATQRRHADRIAFERRRLADADPIVQSLAWGGMGGSLRALQGDAAAAEAARIALSLDPRMGTAPANGLAQLAHNAGRRETAYQLWIESGNRARRDPTLTVEGKAAIAAANQAILAELRHDHLTALQARRVWLRNGAVGFAPPTRRAIGYGFTQLHEPGAARREHAIDTAAGVTWGMAGFGALAYWLQDWPGTLAAVDAEAVALQSRPDHGEQYQYWRWMKAEALARLGRLEEAQAVIAPTPLDCEPCVRVRGFIAEQSGRRAEADHWYREAVRMAPSLADASFEWAQLLLARGERAQAVQRLQAANRTAPKWADPLELWGEALLSEGQAGAAAAKFARAATLAPRWGRLHLKWGEALAAQGKAEAARAKWREAAAMDLTTAEQARVQALLAGRST